MSDLFTLEPRTEPAAIVPSPVRWVPEFLVDEVMPEPRETPDHWLKNIDGSRVVGDEDATTDIAIGETMVFSGFREFGKVELTIRRDGTFDIAGTIDPRATTFCEPGDSDTLSFSIDELATNAIANMMEAENTVEVETYRWDDTTFRLVEGIEGPTFVRVEAEEAEVVT